MRSLIIAVIFLLFTDGALVAATQSAQAADAVGHMMTEQSLPDAAMMNCCENSGSKMGHGYNNCAMDCHYITPFVVVGFRRTVPVKVGSYLVLLTSSVKDFLIRPPIVS